MTANHALHLPQCNVSLISFALMQNLPVCFLHVIFLAAEPACCVMAVRGTFRSNPNCIYASELTCKQRILWHWCQPHAIVTELNLILCMTHPQLHVNKPSRFAEMEQGPCAQLQAAHALHTPPRQTFGACSNAGFGVLLESKISCEPRLSSRQIGQRGGKSSIMLQAQSHCVGVYLSPAALGTTRSSRAVARSQPFRSHSSGSSNFRTGQAISGARPVHHAQQRRSTPSLRVSADVFYTQKTVPDQTGRVAIVTGQATQCILTVLSDFIIGMESILKHLD